MCAGMCAGCPLHASLILNTGSKLDQKEVEPWRRHALLLWYMEKVYVPPLKSNIYLYNN